MASEPDLTRVREGARRALAELDGLDQRWRDTANPDLRTMLGHIGRRKSAQTWRMLQWQSYPAPNGAVDIPPTSSTAHNRDFRPYSDGPAPVSPTDGVAVISKSQVTPELVIFRVERPEGFAFEPGQSVKVGLGDIRRSFSLVSAPHEPYLEFFVEQVPGGKMSERLRQVMVGDPVTLGMPKGGLSFDTGFKDHLMVATVTGINPFISILRDHIHRGAHRGQSGHRIHVMHGASYQQEFGYRGELEAMAASHPDTLRYTPTVSRPAEAGNEDWTGQTGRVDTLVRDALEREGRTPDNTLVYACGHSGMLDSVAEQVRPLGYRLVTENYD